MKVIMVKPGEEAVVTEIGNELKDMQAAVGGYIEAIYPYEDPVALVCNEEGKLNGMEFNRVLIDDNLRPYDVICGPFFICGLTEDSFGDIPEELTEKYLDRFLMAEHITPSPYGGVLVTKYHNHKEE